LFCNVFCTDQEQAKVWKRFDYLPPRRAWMELRPLHRGLFRSVAEWHARMAAHVAHDLSGLVNLIGDSGDLGIAQRIGRNPQADRLGYARRGV